MELSGSFLLTLHYASSEVADGLRTKGQFARTLESPENILCVLLLFFFLPPRRGMHAKEQRDGPPLEGKA